MLGKRFFEITTKHLHVIGIDPGGTTGWCVLTITRKSIFGREPGQFLNWDYGELSGSEPQQAVNLARLIRKTQGLDYPTGAACVIEDWTIEPHAKSTDPETLSPVRIGAMLVLLRYQDLLDKATLTFQNRALAMSTVNDDRLERWGFWVKGSEHIRAATKHALTALRRAKENPEFAEALWPI